MAMKITFAILLFTFSAAADPRPWQFYWENDIGVLTPSSDEDYTNGMRVTIGAKEVPDWANTFIDNYCSGGFCANIRRRSVAMSYMMQHQFYTPQDITDPRPQPLDRPWAGAWMIGLNLQLADDEGKRELHTFEGQLGILGQGAGAQRAQVRWHEIIDDPDTPSGWDHQLRNEPFVNFLYTYNRRWSRFSDRADFIASPGAVVGTLMAYPSIGATARVAPFGHRITGFPVQPLAPAAIPRQNVLERDPWEFYVHAGADARYVLHNATLDGGTFRDEQQRAPGRRHNVYDLRGGFSLRLGDYRITYTLVRRSQEFEKPPGSEQRHLFNSLVFAYEPN